MTNHSWNSSKTMIQNRTHKMKKYSKMTPKWVPKSEGLLAGRPLGVPLVAQTAFVIKKWPPGAPKVLPVIEK